jgi:hypothetical protein
MTNDTRCIEFGQKPMFATKIQPGPSEVNSVEDFLVLADEPAAAVVLENDPAAEPPPIPWHLLFPPGHPMHAAGRA